jgi:PAS domain-containing protein
VAPDRWDSHYAGGPDRRRRGGQRCGIGAPECDAEGIIVYDRELRYQMWNRFMEQLTGRRAEDVLVWRENSNRVMKSLHT